jgi:hypothetical protein
MALSGIQMLLNYEVVPPADVKNILRVLAIQAAVPRTECHLKILQVSEHSWNHRHYSSVFVVKAK